MNISLIFKPIFMLKYLLISPSLFTSSIHPLFIVTIPSLFIRYLSFLPSHHFPISFPLTIFLILLLALPWPSSSLPSLQLTLISRHFFGPNLGPKYTTQKALPAKLCLLFALSARKCFHGDRLDKAI
jgi:hypothetical protein